MSLLATQRPSFESEDDLPDGMLPTATRTPSPTTQQTKPRTMNTPARAPTSKVVTGEIRGSYVRIFKAELPHNAKPDDVPKFGMTLLIPKTDTVTLAKIAAAREVAIAEKFAGKRPAKIDTTLHDGDQPRPSNGEDFGPECAGHMVMAVSSKFKPRILDLDGNEVIDPLVCGSGDYYKVSMTAFAYDFSGKRGVAFGLNNILFTRQGVSLGGRSSAEDDFADDLK